jgi:hypothetical protein
MNIQLIYVAAYAVLAILVGAAGFALGRRKYRKMHPKIANEIRDNQNNEQLELERQRQLELERQKQLELERQRQLELERQKQEQLELE